MTIKIEVTPEEQRLIIDALVFVDGSAAQCLANRLRAQTAKDPTDDGPEVEILRAPVNVPNKQSLSLHRLWNLQQKLYRA